MSILVCTPMFGGMCAQEYFQSCLKLQEELLKTGMPFDFLTTANESLITRGRNTQASAFLETDFETLLFIDADIEFEPKDVASLWNMYIERGAQVCVGAYSRKTESEPRVWVNQELKRLADFDEPIEVDCAATGFMLISRKILEELKENNPEWARREGKVTAFFQDDGCDLSEDYFFCFQARKAGYAVLCDPSIKLNHWGRCAY